MKILHVSDLHIGKRVNEYSMLDDQRFALKQILSFVDEISPDAVIIAGDVYDKSVPSAEAVELLDRFLFALAEKKVECFIISGNHDSAERLAFCNRLIESSGIHISSAYNGEITPVTLEDEFGKVNFYPLPFIKPQTVKSFFGEDVSDYTQAVGLCIEKMNIDRAERNVLITHQFVAGADRTESEEISVGGSDGVSASVFYDFDYVALGHIHRAQSVSRDHIRYSGTPLKYSFSESKDVKGAVIIDLKEKGDISFAFKEIKPLHDMVEIKGTYAELAAKNFYENTTLREDYVKIVLTDEEDVFDAAAKLRVIYKNYMKLSYDNARTRSSVDFDGVKKVEEKTPIELFGELYKMQNNAELSDEQREYISDIIEKVWGTEDAAD